MNTAFESQPVENRHEDSRISYELLTYVFGYMPDVGESVLLDQIAEDLEESPQTILKVLNELQSDKFIAYTYHDGVVVLTYKDHIFLQQYSVYQATQR